MQTSSLHPGTILNSPTQQYRIVEALGAGSFGITYLATSKVKHGNVTFTLKFAIKEHFMESCFRDDNGVLVHCTPASQKNVEQSRKDFITEAKRLQQICQYSRNIVHVNEAFEANGTAYYVMEYLDGGSPKQTDERTALRIIQQVAEAVSILHKNKLLHLDIKPDNIVLNSSENGDTYPVLIDFGITKQFDEKGNPTSSPNVKGVSQGYAPIEQNDVIREFAPTLDIYALGATLLYLLTGKNPPSSVKLIDPSQRELKKLIPTQVSSSTRNAILKAM
ncbi:MAG: serine/threonine protein kinase, partial [Allobaculum sp.]|nr:serine/threonine protein kinase [Allobaculum sp.]